MGIGLIVPSWRGVRSGDGSPQRLRADGRGALSLAYGRSEAVRGVPRKAGKRQPRGTRTVNRHRWPGRVSQGARVNHGQGTRQTDPVTSGEGVPPVGAGGRREVAQATVYQKHMALRNRKVTYRA